MTNPFSLILRHRPPFVGLQGYSYDLVQTQHAAAMAASKRSALMEIILPDLKSSMTRHVVKLK